MRSPNFKDLCSDNEIGESDGKDVRKKQKLKDRSTRQDIEENRSSDALNTVQTTTDQGGSPLDGSCLFTASDVCPAPFCRQFWKAGSYDSGQGYKAKNGKNHMQIHPEFLHSNATSHMWVFGAIAELLDNAVDEIGNGATVVSIDKTLNPRDGSPALLIQDDGAGMDPETIRRCMSFGYSDKKLKNVIGQYGNGFKTSSMRLGADAIVFSRCLKKRTLTQSVGLLSYTFLRRMGHDRIIVPMVDYEFSMLGRTFQAILPHGKELFSSNLSILLQWSPYSTEEELLKQFADIGHHGTKVIIYNLWLNDDGNMELDFNSDMEDIRISGDPKLFQAGSYSDPICDQHIANRYQYSLRVYLSILYLHLPQSFKIILRGRVVEHHNIADDLKFLEFILYKPHSSGNMQGAVITTIGFLKEAPHVNFHGFSIYHRNRLILPFWRVLKSTSGSKGRGVVGVLQANFIEPTHSKQDFEKTSPFQKLEARLKEMTLEYWELHCELIGYHQRKKTHRAPLPSHESVPSRTLSCSYEPVLMNYSSPRIDSTKAFQDSLATSLHVSARSSNNCQIRSDRGLNIKLKEHDTAAELEHTKWHSGSGVYATDTHHNRVAQPANGIENQLQDQESIQLLQENKRLRSRFLELEKQEEELNIKVKRLRNELEEVQRCYEKLLAESILQLKNRS